MTYKVLVTGGRDFLDRDQVHAWLDACHKRNKITHVIHGGCNLEKDPEHRIGADAYAHEWCLGRGVQPVVCMANFAKHGPAGGPMRNQLMADLQPNLVIAFPGGRGTASMVEIAREMNIQVFEAKPRKRA